jgi:hypothetical protein
MNATLEPKKPVPKSMEGLGDFLNVWRDERIAAAPLPPDILYHYTNTSALISILKTRQLWATDALYTNDQTEVLHSLVMLTRIVNEAQKDRAIDIATDMMLIAAEEFYTVVEVYLVCFCRKGDLLSQWRAYGQAGGYAIGFDSTVLTSLTGNHVMLAPVLYDGSKQEQLIRDLVQRWRQPFKDAKLEEFDKQIRRLGAFVFAQAFSFFAATFKSEAFLEEDEWRLVYRRQVVIKDDSGLGIDFRERKGMAASYAPMPLPPISETVVPVRHIVMGATANLNLAGFGLAQFLKSVGYPEKAIHISPSAVPLRQ